MLEQLFKSILEQDKAPVVVCDMESTVVYMNPSAISRYKRDITKSTNTETEKRQDCTIYKSHCPRRGINR